MENLPQHKSQQNSNVITTNDRMIQTNISKFVRDCTDEEIKNAIRYAIVLLGIPETKLPDELGKQVIINHTKKAFGSLRIDEIRLAFDFAIEKKTKCNLNLFQGEFFSAKFISEIIAEYIIYRNANKKQNADEVKMNNNQRLASIANFLTEDTLKAIDNIGKIEKEQPKQRIKTDQEIKIQTLISEFDKLHRDYSVDTGGVRFIMYDNKPMNVEEYVNYKLTQEKDDK